MTIFLYCLAIAAVSVFGGCLPLSKKISHLTLQIYLSLSAGAMLGAACFHMLPEGAELAGRSFGWWTALSVISLYVIKRFLSPHSHEPTEMEEHEDEDDHGHDHHHHSIPVVSQLHSPAPHVAGWSAVAGLSIHTLLGGIALGSAVLGQETPKDLGLAVFLATVLHKPADSLTISTLLIKAGTQRSRTLVVQFFFALLIPIGVLMFHLGQSAIASHVGNAFTGSVLAFSAGTFICIALSDLLPEVQFHSHDRMKLFLAFILGAMLMWGTALIETRHQHEDKREKADAHAVRLVAVLSGNRFMAKAEIRRSKPEGDPNSSPKSEWV